MPYPYLGTAPRQYPQYRDDATDAPLQPEPGGTYSMTPVPGNGDLPVPPGDGLWGPEGPGFTISEPPAISEPEPPAEPAEEPQDAPAKTRTNGNGKAAQAAEEGAGE